MTARNLVLPAAALALLVATPARSDPAAARHDSEAGVAALRDGDLDTAAALLRRAFAADPTNAAIAADLGYALGKRGERREAETVLRRAMALDPKRSSAYASFAELLADDPVRWQRRDEVVAVVEKGLGLLGDDEAGRARVLLALATFERSVGRLASARRRLGELLDRAPAAGAVPASLRKRALDLAEQVAADERARGLEDWPDTPLAAVDGATVKRAQAALDAGDPAHALKLLGPLVERMPAAVEARFVDAQALEALGRHDQAAQELTIIVQLRPSFAPAWRRLGMLLAIHGGTLEAERADEALRHALALEPSWDDLRELRRVVAAKRASLASPRAATHAAPPPSPRAQKLLEEAQRWLADDAPEFAEPLVAQALADSPGYVEAAATSYALTSAVPEATLRALWDDPDALVRLAADAQAIGARGAAGALVGRCLDRAVALGSAEARFRRADLRASAGDRGGALADLIEYVAHEPNPPHLDEARALRANLLATPDDGRGRRALLALLGDHPQEAERLLGGPCRAGLESARLVELGRVQEYAGASAAAMACYERALDAGQPAHAALVRLASAATRAPAQALAQVEARLRQARREEIPAAAWALARLEMQRQRPEAALADIDAFLAAAPPDDPSRGEAEAARAKLQEAGDALERKQALRTAAGAILAAAALLALLLWASLRRLHGVSVERALVRRPALYPELARAIAEVRHDVIKHRASALGMVAGAEPSADVARALLEPVPASFAVAEIYDRVAQAAQGLGLALRPLDREPTFGPLARDLRRAEAALRGEIVASLDEIDRALRMVHAAKLAHLLSLGPRTGLDANLLTGWIRAIEAERAAPLRVGLVLRDIDAVAAVDPDALFTVVANLLRNAAAAVVEQGPAARIVLRVERESDVTGRQLVTVLVADSAPRTPTLEEIEARDGQRGLGLVRDLVRRWGGRLVIRQGSGLGPPEPFPGRAPLLKAIGATFPAAAVPSDDDAGAAA